MVNNQRLILLSELGSLKGLSPRQIAACETAMTKFSVQAIAKFKQREIKEEVISFWKLLFNASWDNTILYMRYLMFRRARRKAKLRAKGEGYKMYIVRKSRIGYHVFSTLDYKYSSRIKILNKKLSAKEMERIAALVVMPDGSTAGKGFSGRDIDSLSNIATNRKRTKTRNCNNKHKNPRKSKINNGIERHKKAVGKQTK